MELLIQFFAILLSVLLATVKTMRYSPIKLSDFELNRRIHAGNQSAMAEQERRLLLPTFTALQYFKEIIISVALAVLLFSTHDSVIGTILSALYFLLAYLIAAKGWMAHVAVGWQRWFEFKMSRFVMRIAPFAKWLAPRAVGEHGGGIASREELRAVIETDNELLAPQDKTRVLAAFDFGSLLVGDVMVPRDKIATVDYKETIGPVLLDRLHKDNHAIFVVIKKDLDHIAGLLYMHDLVPLAPELKEVKDAIRPTVHYLPQHAPLQDVLAASVMTGRQLFMVTDDDGKTKGLITLKDALARLNGAPIPKAAPVETHP